AIVRAEVFSDTIMGKRYLVPAIKRAFDMIELLAKEESGLSISEISRKLTLPMSSAQIIVYTLKDLGYLEQNDANSRYHLSLKVVGLAQTVQDRNVLVTQCHGLMQDLVLESGFTCHLAVLQDSEAVYIDRVASRGFIQFASSVGLR